VVAVPDKRRKRAVDLALGPGFRRLLPVEEASAALSPSPQPTPSGC
jgi:hypothetical protein